MKHAKLLINLFLVLFLLMVTSCELFDSEESEIDFPKPTLDIISGTKGAVARVSGKIITTENIKEISMVVTDANGNVTTMVILSKEEGWAGKKAWDLATDGQVKLTVAASATPGDYTLTITVKTENETTSESVVFEVTAGFVSELTIIEIGEVSNIFGAEAGAFNLQGVDKLLKDGLESKKDIKDASLSTKGLAKSWVSGNGTQFVKLNSFDYDKATVAMIELDYTSGTPTGQVDNLTVGDILLVNIKNAGVYAVIKITEVNLNEGASTLGNKGVIRFHYKIKL